ncbi:MAG: hypothetical protein HYS08_09195 [Chlamydiae bacterium]|nr:hypothetical protein [Candidatus Saccharibacteria bacterium]MBI1884361.1 hypothetical protein [Chlamydiota bacterium]MBI3338266.1 hypothetical protein [Candidatus Saccharibacteria bacterium]
MTTWRLLHVLVQPVIVADDGVTLGPPCVPPGGAKPVPLADLDGLRAVIEAELAALNAQAAEKPQPPDITENTHKVSENTHKKNTHK